MWIDAPGARLHGDDRRSDRTPTLLFLHGWLDHLHSHDWLRDALPPSLRSVAIDFRGHGQSGHVAGGLYHVTDYLADVEATLEACGVERVHLVGHSLGGTVALLYSAARPERVASVTTIESLGPSGGPAGERTVERLRGFVRDLRKPSHKRVYPSIEAAAERLRAGNSGLSERAALHLARHGTRQLPSGGFEFTFDPAHRRTFGISFDEEQTLAAFRAVQCPVQVIAATEGFSFDDAQMSARLEALRARTPVRVPGGHHVHLDAPERIAELIVEFTGR